MTRPALSAEFVGLARAATDTYTGISPAPVPMFLAAQLAGAFAAVTFVRRTADSRGVHV